MVNISQIDYFVLDRPEILNFIFHPRIEWENSNNKNNLEIKITDLQIPVEDNIFIGARFHHANPKSPTIIFFHGNGEIVADYDDIAPFYTKNAINFVPVDYRGYGRSTGTPTVTSMIRDCHIIFDFITKWLNKNNYSGPCIIMGRSLGSASALELAANYQDKINGLILESSFAYLIPLLKKIGVNIDRLNLNEKTGIKNVDKIKNFTKPTLILHAEFDQVIPFSEGEILFNACPSDNKKLVKISGANHNTIFPVGIDTYIKAVKNLVKQR